MVLEARFTLQRPGSYVEALTDGARVVHISGDHEHCTAVVKARDSEQLAEIRRRAAHIIDPEGEPLDQASDWMVLRCHCPDMGPLPVIRTMGCTVVWPIIASEGRTYFHILAPSRTRLEAVIERLGEMGTVELDRVGDVPGDTLDVALPLFAITRNMTPRQLDALRTAIQAGYYGTPRGVTTEELAQSMDLSRSTYQEHLRKAEQAVMQTFAKLLADHPALLSSASKGRGRPPEREKPF